MSGATEQAPSAWTIDSLHAHLTLLITREFARIDKAVELERLRLEERWVTQTKAIETAARSTDSAVRRAEDASSRRFEQVNEFRASLGDLSALMMTRTEAQALLDGINGRLTAIMATEAQSEDRVLVRIAAMEKRLDTNQGVALGASEANMLRTRAIAQMIAIAGVVFGAIGIALSILIATGR